MTYNGIIVKVKKVKKHPNADRLQLCECFNNQVVVDMSVKEGDLSLYFPADGRLSLEFMKANNLIRNIIDGKNIGGMFDENGKVRTQKFLKEKSDGFCCPVTHLFYTGVDVSTLKEGSVINDVNGHHVCEKFTNVKKLNSQTQKKIKEPKIKFPDFHEHIDTEQLAYKLNELKCGDELIITEKLHGTSGRSSYTIMEQQTWWGQLINSLFKRTVVNPKTSYKYVCGTRRVTIADMEGYKGGFDKEDKNYRAPAHALFIGKLHEGETVYYEIVGWSTTKKPIMASADNKKLKDKEFVKKYGKETIFSYGLEPGTSDVYVYRISYTDSLGNEKDLSYDAFKFRCKELGVKPVPFLCRFTYDGDPDALMVALETQDGSGLSQGCSTLTNKHIREGVVVRVDGVKWVAYKHKQFAFKVLEDIIKLDGNDDVEEGES